MTKNTTIFLTIIVLIIISFLLGFDKAKADFWIGLLMGGLSATVIIFVIIESEKPDKEERDYNSPIVIMEKPESKFQKLVEEKSKKWKKTILGELKKSKENKKT